MGISQRIREYIVQNFLLGQDNGLHPSDSLLKKGVLDSTGVLELVMFLEKTFGIEVADEDMVPENLDSINNIAAFLGKKRMTRKTVPSANVDAVQP